MVLEDEAALDLEPLHGDCRLGRGKAVRVVAKRKVVRAKVFIVEWKSVDGLVVGG